MRKEIHLSWQSEPDPLYDESAENFIIKYIKKHPFRLFPKQFHMFSSVHNWVAPAMYIESSLTTKYIIDRDEPKN